LAVVKSLNDFYEVLYTGEMFLTDHQVQKLMGGLARLLGPITCCCGRWPVTGVGCGGR
jgi:hypothetical protein